MMKFFFLLTLCLEVFGQANESRILDFFPARRSLKVNFGQIDGLKVGDFVRFYSLKQNEEIKASEVPLPSEALNSYVGLGRLIKLYPNSSIWRVRQLGPAFKKLRQNERIAFYPLKMFVKKSPKGQRKKGLVKHKEQKVEDLVSKKEKEYFASDEIKFTAEETRYDLNAEDVFDESDLDNADRNIHVPLSYRDHVKKMMLAKSFSVEKTHQQILQDKNFDWDKFYKIEHANEKLNPFPSVVNESRVYEEVKKMRKMQAEDWQKLKKFMKKRGMTFSDHMNNDELYRLVKDYGEEFEQERFVSSIRRNPAILFHGNYAFNLIESSYISLLSSYGYAVGIEFPAYYFLETLEKVTLDFNYLRNYRYFNLKGSWANTDEMAFSLGTLFYFFNSPLDIREILFYAGLHFVIGKAKVVDDYGFGNNYTTSTLPFLEAGAKYRLNRWMGTSMNALYGYTHFHTSEFQPRFNADFYRHELTLKVGLSIYF